MEKSISLLLGAGFSAPMGYPVGNRLNKELLGLDGTEFRFDSNGMIVVDSRTGKRSDWKHETYGDRTFAFCRELMKYFKDQKEHFDYERFYDFLKDEALNDKNVKEIALRHNPSYDRDDGSGQWIKRESIDDSGFNQLMSDLDMVYNQIISYTIKDGKDNRNYETDSLGVEVIQYSGIQSYIRSFIEQGIINVHTLNHDVFFEALQGQLLSDGFEEIGSPYYADLTDNWKYSVRLERYTGNYDKPCRLYKLHGSVDYYYYSLANEGNSTFYPENYVKLKQKVDENRLKKEVLNNDGSHLYKYAPPGYYHSDFLTGTTSKIFRYEEPLLYKKLFDHFQENLQQAEKVIIIGYGGRDEKVNEMILENFDYRNKPSYIIDPYAEEAIREFGERLGAKLLPPEKTVETVTIQDLQ